MDTNSQKKYYTCQSHDQEYYFITYNVVILLSFVKIVYVFTIDPWNTTKQFFTIVALPFSKPNDV